MTAPAIPANARRRVAKCLERNFTFSETATAHAFFEVQSRQTNQLGRPALVRDLLFLFHHRAFAFAHVVFHLDDHFLHFGVLGCLLLDHEEECCLDDLASLVIGRGFHFLGLGGQFGVLSFEEF